MLWLRALLFTIVFPGTVTVLLPWLVLSSEGNAPGAWRFAAVLPFGFGIAVYLWCVRDFVVRGRGTPAPWDAPRKLVVAGLYRYTRNPMYVGILLIVLGEAVWFGSGRLLAYAAAVWLLFTLFIVLYEEPVLRRDFGDEYERYGVRVGRWLPRIGGGRKR